MLILTYWTKTMIKTLFLLLLISESIIASNIPKDESSTGLGLSLRHFHKFSATTKSLIEMNIEKENELTTRKEFKIGARYRLHQNIKVSAYFKRSYGVRHQNDWIKENGSWVWLNSSDRGENTFGTDLSYRTIYQDNILELRSTLERNLFNDQTTIKIRPGITHLFLKTGSPFINLFLQYEAYFPLNYHEKKIYKHGIYSGILYHWRDMIKPGLFIKFTKSTWNNSDDASIRNVPNYEVTESSTVFGTSINFYY